ncbi:MAG: M20/M25/M40 family metallo-hydrolase [Clostridia bacterium]
MKIDEILQKLDKPVGVSGSEENVRTVVKELFAPLCHQVAEDALGNVMGYYRCGIKNAPTIMIEAHQDELGLMVSGISDEGSLLFIEIGGFDPKTLPGTEVTVHCESGDFFGVIGAKPPHLVKNAGKALSIENMAVDIGFNKEQTEKIVKVGDIITLNTGYTPLNGSIVAGRCIDDRGGLAAVVRTLEIIQNYRLSCDVVAVATVQEELGLRGAKTAAAVLQPTAAIAIDVCHGTSPGVSDNAYPLGKGPVVSVGPNLHPKLTRQILNAAKDIGIEVQIDVDSGDTGTDAWEIQVAGTGVPTALLSIPLRYMHANYEVGDTKDIENASRLIAACILKFEGGEQLCY